VDATSLRAEFPVLSERAYLNAGTCGPLARKALNAVADVLARAAVEGRSRAYM
jgi:L-cysteine/cystine lyase